VIWHVTDQGRIELRLRAEGEEAIKVAKIKGDTFIANIVTDLSGTLGADVITDELRYSFSKVRPEVTIIWRARVPEGSVAQVQEYLAELGGSLDGDEGGETVEGTVIPE
jgi:hypothetical protein